MILSVLIGLLCVSILGLTSVIALKRWELSTGKVVFGGLRPRAGRALGGVLNFIEAGIPVMARRSLKRSYAIARTLFHRFVAWVVLRTERLLERTLRTLRGATQPRTEGEASDFLREVAAHKRSLLKKSAKSRVIYEE